MINVYKIQEPLLDYININKYYFGVSIYRYNKCHVYLNTTSNNGGNTCNRHQLRCFTSYG